MSNNPIRIPIHLGGQGIATTGKQFSVYVSRTLDCLGKSHEMVKYRTQMKKEEQKYLDIYALPLKHMFSGSTAEGLISPFESDIDNMYVLPEVICADNAKQYTHNKNLTIFETERHETPAGYTKLKLVQSDHFLRCTIYSSMFRNINGERYISSDLFIKNIRWLGQMNTNTYTISGPSIATTYYQADLNLNLDLVNAFVCVCPKVLQAFLSRPRRNNRPSRRILKEISNMDAHVVPVGYKDSETSYLEWRICFTKAEIHLVHQFSDIETKLYILLKMIAKMLQPISSDITSYVMKNIVLWLVELYPADMFTEDLLTIQLIQALILLKQCVDANYLPNYMIPDRNLLAGRLELEQRQKLTSCVTTLIREDGYLLLRCEKLRVAMVILYREPDIAEEFKWRRNLVDKLTLYEAKEYVKHLATGLSKEQVNKLLHTDKSAIIKGKALQSIIVPEWRELLRQGYSHNNITAVFLERKIHLLS